MNLRILVRLFLFSMIFLTACGVGSQQPTPTEQQKLITATKEIPEEGVEVSQSEALATPTPSLSIDNLLDAESAIIRIESKGHFFTPKDTIEDIQAGFGSGFIIDSSGLAITTNHAVTGADTIQVWVGPDGDAPVSAEIVAISECSDLALLDLEGDGYRYLEWSDYPVESGQKVYIAGFPFGSNRVEVKSTELTGTNVPGILPRLYVPYLIEYETDLVQEVAGGPVLLPNGQVIGIHYGSVGEPGVQSGIFRESLVDILPQLRSGQDQLSIGLNAVPLVDENTFSGIWVVAVEPGSIADQAGIQGGDWLVGLDQRILATDGTISEYCQILYDVDLNGPIDIQVVRGAGDEFLEGQLNGVGLIIAPTPLPPGAGGDILPSGEEIMFEQFDEPLDSKLWDYFLTNGVPDQVSRDFSGGKLTFEISFIYTYPYYIYKPLEIGDVRLSIYTNNLGFNNNNVTLVCRYSELGWYEFNAANNGYYYVKRYDPTLPDFQKYVSIGKGGTFSINLGQRPNNYGFECKGDELIVIINGKVIRTYQDSYLDKGKVGFGVGSYNVTPIVLELDDFIVQVP